MSCALAVQEAPESKEADIRGLVARLSSDVDLIHQLLESDYQRLETYVRSLRRGAARGRTVDEIVTDPALRAAFVRDVQDWAKAYKIPSFTRDINTIVKLKSFLSANLP